MSTKTSIEWTDVTWNPVRGCALVSSGCANCYAMKQAHRFSGPGKPYEGLTELGPHGPRWTGKIQLVPELLKEPLRWKQPRRVFVNSMSDLFHPDVPAQFIVECFEIMAACPQHTFQILTKRPERIESVLYGEEGHWYLGGGDWLPNVMIGISAEDQLSFEKRWAVFQPRDGEHCSWAYAMRLFASLEPLLGKIDIQSAFHGSAKLLWVIVGGESGTTARPCEIAWIRSIVQQCRAANVPVFTKQTGSYNACQHNRKGGCWDCIPGDIKIREFPVL